ncbi:hypothetical protein GCM10025865_30460 [Paraoerskovia sediminicola]|uniref:HTH arsR-type domain-containing protein n=1 Tax=Paraoerskovia sediminicola TaxID=1138587 RepID=A0ABN6XFQ6_9CELL|nr:helix-turn-helix domain-containing protein [Paraoerskovia sediminicola]BDZ43747.1 hypothetical protein GCM10025865_30460 [Paraoerskovia sediminicola]
MTSPQIPPHRALSSESRVALLDLLHDRGHMTVTELAEGADLHPNTAREHLQVLCDAGFVAGEPEKRTTRGRPRTIYRALRTPDPAERQAPSPRASDAVARKELTQVLLQGFGERVESPAEAAREAGRQAAVRTAPWAPGEAPSDPVAALDMHLDAMGFAPRYEDEPPTFHLHRCPFADLARQRPEVVCEFHLGLAQGVLSASAATARASSDEEAPTPMDAPALHPFVGPQHCVLDLARRTPGQG